MLSLCYYFFLRHSSFFTTLFLRVLELVYINTLFSNKKKNCFDLCDLSLRHCNTLEIQPATHERESIQNNNLCCCLSLFCRVTGEFMDIDEHPSKDQLANTGYFSIVHNGYDTRLCMRDHSSRRSLEPDCVENQAERAQWLAYIYAVEHCAQ